MENCSTEKSAIDLALEIYSSCLKDFKVNCIKPKALSWLSKAVQQDEIKITNELTIVRTGEDNGFDFDKQQQRSGKRDARLELFDKIDSFLATHSLKINAPEFLKSSEARSFIPNSYLEGGLTQGVEIPLTDGNAVEGRGFVKRIMLPFLLGLKFKSTVLVPLALSLIALKTWKAMTLGLLSLVLSGAILIFKVAKPKFAHYEVVHYPHHHHVEHHVDHIVPHHHIDHIVPHHVDHIVPHHHIDHIVPHHHIDHIVPHHIEHIVPHHIDHHIDHVPHHIEHIVPHEHVVPHHIDHHHIDHHHIDHHDHIDAPHGWARSSDNGQPQDAQEIAYKGQIPN
ncbi:uncharacterized protein LOC129613201 [Condylostylus longicornis]|uniref:uncharacterized protein LOC129613201 n=1 Tax=Condylostylus longicornis TaxID=2530218 RepID=UPI00244DCCC1|nr:uncharacterized protein LOC129613201 [Condylostylus longicornis]